MTTSIYWVLIITTFVASGYCLQWMCLLRRIGRDPRPASFSVFVTLAQGVMYIVTMQSRSTDNVIFGWSVVGVATVILICWLVVINSKNRRGIKNGK